MNVHSGGAFAVCSRRWDCADYFAATEDVRGAASSFSTAVLQPALRLACCFFMQASVAWIFGIVELQRRHASPVHACRVSALQAKLGVERVEKETAKAAMSKAWRTVLVKSAIIVDSQSAAQRHVVDA
jgi:hypothetical protein